MQAGIPEFVVGQVVRDRGGQPGKLVGRRVQVAGVHILQVNALPVSQVEISFELQGHIAQGAILPGQDGRYGHVHEQRGQQLVGGHVELEFPQRPAVADQVDVEGHGLRRAAQEAQDAGAAVLGEAADRAPGDGHLIRVVQRGNDGDDLGLGHAVSDGTEII